MSTQGNRASVTGRPRSTSSKEYQAMGHWRFGSPRSALRRLGSVLAAAMLVGSQLAIPVVQAAPISTAAAPAAAPAAPTTSTVTLSVKSARTEPRAFGGAGVVKGAVIDTYKYMINIDNTGTTGQRSADPGIGCSSSDAGYPDSCKWVSIAGVPGSAPIYQQGDQTDFPVTLPAGPDGSSARYVISVMADGYKLDGANFTVPTGGAPVAVIVELQPTPLPTATIRARVFEDISPVNGAPDEPAEHGLAGFKAVLFDYIGRVTTDVFGNPLCSTYETDSSGNVILLAPDYAPTLKTKGAGCYSDPNGDIVIPNMGTNRYAMSVTPPIGQGWVQTTTLEGNHDWDTWVMEGATGFDTEFVVAGEPFPPVIFGFVKPTNTLAGGAGEVKGFVGATKAYIPPKGGTVSEPGLLGAKVSGPIDRPWISLTDLNNNDTAVYVGRGNADGTFDITGVPDGTYTLTYWDEPQDYILGIENVTVVSGEHVDIGDLHALGWWTQIDGYVFNDLNENGKMDAGEPGIPNFSITMKKRENSVMDRGAITVTTDASGHYFMENAYPITQWLVEEAYADQWQTTGVTYQADNQPTPTTVLGSGVDVSVLPIIGLGGRLDWGVKAYDPGTNGGIVGTVTYDTTRNELDPRYAVTENWQPGVPNLTVDLYAPVKCDATAGTCDPTGRYQLAPDGSYALGSQLNSYVTENWQRPTDCVARDLNGDPLTNGINAGDQQVLPKLPDGSQDTSKGCLEGPLMGVQFAPYATDQTDPAAANFGATVDGNYGFGDGCFGTGGLDATTGTCADGTAPTALIPADYLVKVEIPSDASGRPMYKVTKEEDINIFHGDQFVPQEPPPACAGALHTVDVKGIAPDGPNAVDNPDFAGAGGSYYEGQKTPLCDVKLVKVVDQRSIAPNFNIFTDVPLPARFWGLIVDDLNFSSNPKSLGYGEKAGVPFAPVGIYDYTNRLVTTVESDYNGLFDVLLPSTNRISCPTPSGVCPNLYRFVGNDPGVPGRLNDNYNPQYRTIAAEFEAFPGLLVPADLAPTQVGVSVQLPGSQVNQAVACSINNPDRAIAPTTPELFAVSRPYVTPALRTFTIDGQGFGGAPGSVTLGGTALPAASVTWGSTQIGVTVPVGFAEGPQQLKITAANGRSTVNGLTIHVTGSTYNPTILEVGPGKTYAPAETLPAAADHAIQRALDAASPGALVVVYPNNPTADKRQNPRGAYYENLIIHSAVKLQGVGPGGVRSDGSTVRGSIIDGAAFGGDSPVAADWLTKIDSLTWAGNQTVNDGAVISIYVPGSGNSAFNAGRQPMIDGFDIRGGDQAGFPTNINEVGGTPTGLPATIVTQGGAIFANAYANDLQISNNVVQNNGGGYGTIRIGTPDLPAPATNNHNERIKILNNRVIANAGTNLAGGIGLFAGADSYEVARNDICGNFSAEYGGGLSAYGLSPNGKIHDNRIYENRSYDEGGGVIIAGQLPAGSTLSPGSGPVDIYNNLIQANIGNDDGGGIRFLMAGNFPMNVYDNFIVNNVSTHQGGGIAIDDAPKVRIYNNTIAKNITTATALTSTGVPAPAGLSTTQNSDQLQVTLALGSPLFSNPLLFNNIWWDNRAGSRGLDTVTGIGQAGDSSTINLWDVGVADGSGTLNPDASDLVNTDPLVKTPIDIPLSFVSWRTNINYIGALMAVADFPTPDKLGDYHLTDSSPAKDQGIASHAVPSYQQPPSNLAAPTFDIDNEARSAPIDIGADEIPAPPADLAITKTDGVTSATAGGTVTYTIVVSNAGPNGVTNAPVTDTFPSALTVTSWTCAGNGAGNSCTATGTGNSRTGAVTLASGGSATFTAITTLARSVTSGSLANTASVAAPAGRSDPNTANNNATDTDTIVPRTPTLTLLDNFNRANANNLGGNWSQAGTGTSVAIRVSTNQAFANTAGQAIWNLPTTGFGADQAAAFTFANTPVNNSALILKATGGTATAPANFICVRYEPSSTRVRVYTTTASSCTSTTRATFTVASGYFATGNTLSAVAYSDGVVAVFKTSGTTTTLVGSVLIPTSGTGSWTQGAAGGRIGMSLPLNARVDDFSGGNQ